MSTLNSNHTIYRKHNYRNIELTRNEPGASVGVLLSDGGLHYMSWGGLISRQDAKVRSGRPVKLKVSRVDGYDLKPGEYLIGCIIEKRVFAIIDTAPAIVKVG